jgi:non-specific protein-tyrosine kinase
MTGVVSQISMQKNSIYTILNSRNTGKHLKYLEKMFDLILIDMPPVKLSISSVALSCKLDGVILVVDAGSTRWQSAYKLKENIELQGGKILGVLLNKRHHYIPNFIYNLL